MENATDALYIGFAVLAFVVALSISIFSFSQVVSASQTIIDARDKTTLYSYIEPNGTERIVSREDIIPTLYRAYYENYLVRFKGISLFNVKSPETGEYESTDIIDLESQRIGNHDDADKLITALLSGERVFLDTVADRERFGYFEYNYLPNSSLYDILGEGTFKESVGIYYMEDRDKEIKDSGVDDVNRTTKRIITYTKVQ